MSTPLDEIFLSAGSLTLTSDVLGNGAYAALATGLKLSQSAQLSACTLAVSNQANLFIVQGTLASLLGLGPTAVRLYLFEVARIGGTTDRHAVLIFTAVPAALTAAALIGQFCPPQAGALPAELLALSALALTEQTLLFSTLDYGSAIYQTPPFPPLQDANAPLAFIEAVAADVIAGFVFRAQAQLQSSVTFPLPPDAPADAAPETLELATVLDPLGLGAICTTPFALNAKIKFSPEGIALGLCHALERPMVAAAMPFAPALTQMGIGFPLGSGRGQMPAFEFDGTLTFSKNPTKVRMAFAPSASVLTVGFADLPDMADLERECGGFLGPSLAQFLPPGAMDAVGALTLQGLRIAIDCDVLDVSALTISVTTEQPLALFDGIEVQLAMIGDFTNPLQSYRTYDVQVLGTWFFKSTELDVRFEYAKAALADDDQAALSARLALGSGINFVDLAAQLFHAELCGLPLLVLSDIEVAARRSGSGASASESISIALEVAAGWTLAGIDLALDDLNLQIEYTKASASASWVTQAARAQGTLDLGPAFFSLEADYDASAKSWTFSGGSLPGETLNLGQFLGALTTALGLAAPGDFLAPFHDVQVTGCYLQYQTSSAGSPSWKVTVATDFVSGGKFFDIQLDQIVVGFHRDGTGTSLSFDATTPGVANQGVGAVTDYLSQELGVNVALPACLSGGDIQLKGLSALYNTATHSYNLVAYLNFGQSALVQLQIQVVSQTQGGMQYDLGGTLIFNPGDTDELTFTLELVKTGAASDLVASFHAGASQGMSLGKLVKAIAPSASGLDQFDIDIKDALFAHSSAHGALLAKSLFAVDMGAAVSLSKLEGLPLIGHALADIGSLDLAFQVVYATGAYSPDELQAINNLLGNASFCFPAQAIGAGSPAIATAMRVGGDQLVDMAIPVATDAQGTLAPTGSSVGTSDPNASNTGGADGITWFPLNKAFGPMHMSRVGLAFDKASTSIAGYLDGGLTVGGLSFDLLGLNVVVPLKGSDKFHPSFGLQGVGLNYTNGLLDIGGALVKQVIDQETSFDGFVTVSTESLQIGAVGSFAKMQDGHNSLFVYAVLAEPLGGPAFFFVTGLAAGFGYNRKLIPPAIADVQNFPLVSEAMAPTAQPPAGGTGGVRDYVAQKLALMRQDVVPAAGKYFLAAGVKFTSFKLIDGFLLAVVQFGNEFRIDLLGLANASLPPDDDSDPIAEAQLAILAHYIASEGAVWVQGQLTPNSFILSRDCHLTGGFAMAFWVSGVHDGEFVVSIGGYAPGFHTPAYYPQPPRVGFNWQVSGNLSVKGDGYFALVPHALMAGGSWNAVWNSGPVSAWYVLGADFLIEWKPFHYSADIYVDIGAELTIHFFGTHHVSIDASADLSVWGPEFGGHARISVSVIGIHFHFNIDFGDSSSALPALAWDEFHTSFLPADSAQWLGINIQGGLIRTVTATLADGTTAEVWIVKRDELNLATSSALPIKCATFTLDGSVAAVPALGPVTPGIAPMDVGTIATSTHGIAITKVGQGQYGATGNASEQLQVVATGKKIPSGLWGHARSRPLNAAPGEDVLDSVCGFSIVPVKQASEDPAAITVARSTLAYETVQETAFDWVSNTGSFKGTESTWQAISQMLEATKAARATALGRLGFGAGTENINQALDRDAPLAAQLGTWGS